MMTQYGFFFDQSRCTGCHGCSIVCKTWNDLPPGPEKWMRVFQWESGGFPDISVNTLAVPCYHCEDAPCIAACPGGAIQKEERFGAVLVHSARCEEVHREMDCRRCWQVCPYGAPQFASDDQRATMSKCTMCVDRLYEDQKPTCVLGCSLRALDFDTMDNLRQWYGPGDALQGLPKASKIKSAAIFRRRAAKRQLVPWDAAEALKLWRGRGSYAPASLPPVLDSIEDATSVPTNLMRRDKLVLKPRTVEELMFYTSDDE